MALGFDNAGDRLERYTNPPSGDACTMMGWFYLVSTGTTAPLLRLAEDAGNSFVAYVNTSSQLTLYASSIVTGTTLSTGIWYHVAMVADGTNVTIYLDGELDSQAADLPLSTFRIVIGNDSDFGTGFVGRAVGIKIYDAALTQEEIQIEMNQQELGRTENVNSWFPMVDDTAAACLKDNSGFARDLALVGSVTVEDGPGVAWRQSEARVMLALLDAVSQFARPDGDVSAGTWTTTTLFSKVDDDPADDADFISSVSAPVNTICELSLSDVDDPFASTGHILRVRRKKTAESTNQMDMRYRILQGATQIASWADDTNISETAFAAAERTLTGAEADAITNYADLRVEIRANQNTQAPAAPTFVAAGSVASGTTGISVSPPSGLLNGDVLLLFIATENQAVATPSPGWAIVTDSPQSTGTAGNTAATRLSIFWKRTNGSEGVATAADPGDSWVGRMAAFRGCIATGDPWDVTAGGVLSTASTAVSINGDTTTVANCLIVAAFSHSTDINSTVQVSGWTNASLASITERIDDSTTSGDGDGIGVATGVKVVAGAYSATTATLVTASNQGRISIALKPPANPSIAAQVSWVEFEVPPAGVAPVVDDFNRANGGLGSGWEHVKGASAMVISSNTAIAGASFEQEIERRSEATFPDDQFAQAKIQFTTGANASETGVAVRIDGSGNCYYARVGDTTITLRKIVAGVDTFITDFSLAHSVSTYYTVKLEVIGNNLIVTQDGVERINTNDTDLTTGKPGIYANGNSDRPALDDFEATAGQAGPGDEYPSGSTGPFHMRSIITR